MKKSSVSLGQSVCSEIAKQKLKRVNGESILGYCTNIKLGFRDF